MIGVVIVTHGGLGGALLNAAELIMGKQEHVQAVAFESGQAVTDLQVRIAQASRQVDKGQGTLILVDILGGSPYNASALLAVEQTNTEVITGVNLPMLFSILPVRNLDLTSIADVAVLGGRNGIKKFTMNHVS
ncbi:PTS sugar transporter subunit IIA [Pelosinus sp. sgz500959]|uniref:PTS sugar transporter subunit IIA n=1 Tax=Pelosinus sp. sgz500959 TaxID=3242472 RepID=UPI00366C2EA5